MKLLLTSATALVVALSAALPHAAHPDRLRPPSVPGNIRVPAGNKAFLKGHAVGTQNYICLPSGSTLAWVLFGPQATLFNSDDNQIITHFLSSNPDEAAILRATWQHSRDTSTVWAQLVDFSSDANYVAPGAIPWFLLRKVGDQDGPTGGDKLTPTTYIHRVNTVGGIAPVTGCAVSTDVGKKAFVPYTADYVFYAARDNDGDEDR
jgi:Protein of unknown function (DUF3455)